MAITDLTGTKWQFNNQIDTSGFNVWHFYGTTYNSQFGPFDITNIRKENNKVRIWHGSNEQFHYDFYWKYQSSSGGGYVSTQAPTIEITGGSGVTNTDFIEWLQDNATQIIEGTTFDLSTLSLDSGSHAITAKATAIGYTDSAASNSVTFTVASAPSITAQPQAASYNAGGTATPLTVGASVSDGGTLSYQWQKSTDSGSTWSDISGATSSTYTPDVSTASTYMYRCVVTNTLNGTTASTTSNAATITVTAVVGYTVTISTYTADNGNWIRVYDGENNSAPLLFADESKNLVPLIVTSGYMYVKCSNIVSDDTDAGGGVSIISQTYGEGGDVLCAVTGDGWLYVLNYCYIKGTPITLSDRTYKNVEDITYDDELLVWDFDKGCFASAYPIWIMKTQKAIKYNHLVFSDGSELNTVNQHRIFNIEAGKFTYPMTDETPIGTTTMNDKGQFVKLISKEVINETVEYYNVITNYHINCFAGTILTSCRLSNIYPIQDLRYVKDDRVLRPITDFNCSQQLYDGLRLSEQLDSMSLTGNYQNQTIKQYVEHLEKIKR